MSNKVINFLDKKKEIEAKRLEEESSPDTVWSLSEEGIKALKETELPKRDLVPELSEDEIKIITLLALEQRDHTQEELEKIINWADRTIISYTIIKLLLEKRIRCAWDPEENDLRLFSREG